MGRLLLPLIASLRSPRRISAINQSSDSLCWCGIKDVFNIAYCGSSMLSRNMDFAVSGPMTCSPPTVELIEKSGEFVDISRGGDAGDKLQMIQFILEGSSGGTDHVGPIVPINQDPPSQVTITRWFKYIDLGRSSTIFGGAQIHCSC